MKSKNAIPQSYKCKNSECEKEFILTHGNRKYCSKECEKRRRKLLNNPCTVTQNDIIKVKNSILYTPIPSFCIYFIWDENIIVYIGSAKYNPTKRIEEHYVKRRKGAWKFTHVTYLVWGNHDNLVKQEYKFITYYRPKYNNGKNYG